MTWYESTGEHLGARWHVDGQQAWVFGVRGNVDFHFIGNLIGPEEFSLSFVTEKPLAQIRFDLSHCAKVHQAFADSWLLWRDKSISLSANNFCYRLDGIRELKAGQLESVLDAVIGQIEPTPLERCCCSCARLDVPLALHGLAIARICHACEELLKIEGESLDLSFLQGFFKSLPLWLLTLRFSAIDFEAESLRLSKEYEADRFRFWLQLLLWVFLGQLGLSFSLLFAVFLVTFFLVLCFLALYWKLGGFVFALFKFLAPKLWPVLLVIPLLTKGLWRGLKARLFGVESTSKELPGGRWLERKDPQVARVFSWLDELSGRCRAPCVQRLLLTAQCNAFATEMKHQRKRAVVIGLGFPLFELLRREELESVLFHELAHLKHDDVKRLWVHRTVEAWREVAPVALESGSLAIPARFCGWFYPRFLLRARVVARSTEHLADQLSCQEIGPQGVAVTLAKISVFNYWYERELRTLVASLAQTDEEPLDPVGQLIERLLALSPEKVNQALQAILAEDSGWNDSHPTLKKRLENLAVEMPDPLVLERPTNWHGSLFDHLDPLKADLYRDLQNHIHSQVVRERRRQRALQLRLQRLAPGFHLERAGLLQQLDRHAEALDQLEVFLEGSPGHPEALLLKVRVLQAMGRKDEALAVALGLCSPDSLNLVHDQVDLAVLLEDLGASDAKAKILGSWFSCQEHPPETLEYQEPPPDGSLLVCRYTPEKVCIIVPRHPRMTLETILTTLLCSAWIFLSVWALISISSRQIVDGSYWLAAGFAIIALGCSLWGLPWSLRQWFCPLKVEISEERVVLTGAQKATFSRESILVKQDQNSDSLEQRVCLETRGQKVYVAEAYTAAEVRWLLRVLRHYLM